MGRELLLRVGISSIFAIAALVFFRAGYWVLAIPAIAALLVVIKWKLAGADDDLS